MSSYFGLRMSFTILFLRKAEGQALEVAFVAISMLRPNKRALWMRRSLNNFSLWSENKFSRFFGRKGATSSLTKRKVLERIAKMKGRYSMALLWNGDVVVGFERLVGGEGKGDKRGEIKVWISVLRG